MDEEERLMKKVEEEKYPVRNTSTNVNFKFDNGTWEVNLIVVLSRTTVEGKEESFEYKVKAYDKDMNRALATVQMSTTAYLNTHTEDELYGHTEDQVTGNKDSKA
jgi:hypothetical protein